MRPSSQRTTAAIVCLVVLASAAVVTVALSGSIVAQSGGNVTLQDPIPEDSSEFEVEITALPESTSTPTGGGGPDACLFVDNQDNQDSAIRFDVSEGDTVTVDVDDIGGIQRGDSVRARLLDHDFECAGVLDEDTTTVTEAAFEVTIESTNSPVSEGDTYELQAEVTNTGAQADNQQVDLVVAGDVKDTESVSLDGQSSFTYTLTWETEPGDAGDYTVSVATDDDEAVTDARVTEPAAFAVDDLSTNSPVLEGETMEFDATVRNTADRTATKEVVLTIDGSRIDSTNVTLDGGESTRVSLTWETAPGDAGDYTAGVATPSDTAETAVTVEEPAQFTVDIDSTSSPVTEGDTLDVRFTVENTGTVADSQDLVLRIDGSRIDSTAVSLDGGESTTMTLTWPTGAGDEGDHTARVESDDDDDSAAVSVTAAATDTTDPSDGGSQDGDANFEVNITDVRQPESAGDPLEVDATIENTGPAPDTQTVTLTVDGVERDSREVTLDSGESRSVTFSWTDPDDAAQRNLQVASEDDTDESSVGAVDGTDTDDNPITDNAGAILLLLLLLLLLLVYYYLRRRRQQTDRVPVDDDAGEGSEEQ